MPMPGEDMMHNFLPGAGGGGNVRYGMPMSGEDMVNTSPTRAGGRVTSDGIGIVETF